MVGEGPPGLVGENNLVPEVEMAFFAPCTLVGTFPSQQDALLVLYRVTCRASGNIEIIGL